MLRLISGIANHQLLQYNAGAGEWQNVDDPTEVSEIDADTDLDAAGTTTGVFFVDTSGGDVTLTISNASTTISGTRMSIFKHTDDGNHVIVTTVGGVQEIGGYTS